MYRLGSGTANFERDWSSRVSTPSEHGKVSLRHHAYTVELLEVGVEGRHEARFIRFVAAAC